MPRPLGFLVTLDSRFACCRNEDEGGQVFACSTASDRLGPCGRKERLDFGEASQRYNAVLRRIPLPDCKSLVPRDL